MNAKVKALRVADEPAARLEQRRSELLAERDRCDGSISALRAKRSDAAIDGRFDDADRLDVELTAELSKRARIDDTLERLQERLVEARHARMLQERVKHNAEMSRRIEALASKLVKFEEQAQACGALGREIGKDVEAIHALGIGYLTVDQAVLHRLRGSLHGLVGIMIDMPLGREVPLYIASETGRGEWLATYAPARIIAEARRNYLAQDSTPPEEAA
jgi:exonuclease VII large subunit